MTIWERGVRILSDGPGRLSAVRLVSGMASRRRAAPAGGALAEREMASEDICPCPKLAGVSADLV